MFLKKLLKLYFVKIIGITTSIFSYTIVIPKISSDIGSYGIYSVVVSLLIFLTYADLGFLGAGQKYAAECYARDDRNGEIQILSFVHFILFVVVLVYLCSLLYVYFNPLSVFNNANSNDVKLAKRLILIFIISSPLIVIQRFVSAVFSIRIEEYVTQTIDIICNAIKIISTFYFFRPGHYGIVDYILFIQLVSFIAVIINIWLINKRYKYEFLLVIKSFKFNKKVFMLTKNMALTSILASISWILYYELDPFYVSKLYNPKLAALFAIGVTMLTFTRTLMSAFFSPFQTKFNHLRGLRDDSLLTTYFSKLVELAAPISLILPIGIIVLMRPLIISWIGFDYIQSIMISRVLMINLMFAFLAGPINLVALAKEKYKFLLISSLALPLLYLVFFLLLNKNFGLISLPIAKVLTIFSSLIINLILFKTVMSFPLGKLMSNILLQISFPMILLAGLLFITMPIWDIEVGKNIFVFFKIITVGGVCILISSLSYYLINPNTRNLISRLFVKFKLRLWAI